MMAAGADAGDAIARARQLFSMLDGQMPSTPSPIAVGGQGPVKKVMVRVNGVKMQVDPSTPEGKHYMTVGTVLPPRQG